MPWPDDIPTGNCAFHGNAPFKFGFCLLCISMCHEHDAEEATYRLALRQLTVYQETPHEVCADEAPEDSISPTPPTLQHQLP